MRGLAQSAAVHILHKVVQHRGGSRTGRSETQATGRRALKESLFSSFL